MGSGPVVNILSPSTHKDRNRKPSERQRPGQRKEPCVENCAKKSRGKHKTLRKTGKASREASGSCPWKATLPSCVEAWGLGAGDMAEPAPGGSGGDTRPSCPLRALGLKGLPNSLQNAKSDLRRSFSPFYLYKRNSSSTRNSQFLS